jgi:YVTN family beta-propeller protein
MPHACWTLPVFAICAAAAAQAPALVDFESGPVHPIRLSPDGSRLFACDTLGNRLSVFDLRSPGQPMLLAEIPVGLEPVSVQPRTDDEVWVVNLLSDSVSIVSVDQGCVIDTLRVKDEPSDVVFAGGLAFVSAATTDDVKVFDAVTRTLVATVPVFGKDPRALARSADGSRVYAVVQRSGNGTTIIPQAQAPPPPPPTNSALPPAPRTGLIVRADDPAWASVIPYTLPDYDVAEIDVATRTVRRYFAGVGTTNTGIAVHPVTGELWVANTDARNLVRFEPNLRGHCIDSRLTRITTGAAPVVTAFDLNPGVAYNVLPNPAALGTALAEPFDVAIDPAGVIYVAAQGTDRIGVLDSSGNVLARIEVSNTPGAMIDTHHKRGPRGLALGPGRLYVLNRLSDTISVIDTQTRAVTREVALASHDAMPPALRTGRKFLYDAKLSGNGTMSCAACHIDGDVDGIAWDLGDPGGSMQAQPTQPYPFNLNLTAIHPMKGPMTTQTLRGLADMEPLHWRGDRATFQDFNGAFVSLLGANQLATADMDLFAGFGTSVTHPPNPNQELDRRFLLTPSTNNQWAGYQAFQMSVGNIPPFGPVSCSTCHTLPRGTNRMIVSSTVIIETQQLKVPQLRNVYRKAGFNRAPGPQKSGFGYTKDGAVDNLASLVNLPQFGSWPNAIKDDIATYLMVFDSGMAPLVGWQTTMTQANATSPALAADQQLLIAATQVNYIDLVCKGLLDGRPAGLLFQPATGLFLSDRIDDPPFTLAMLVAKAQQGNATLTFTGVPPGSGRRIGIDRDLDGTLDGDEGVLAYGAGTAGCRGTPALDANSEPRAGNSSFAMVASRAAAGAPVFLLAGAAPGSRAVAGITVLIDLTLPTQVLFRPADLRGQAAWPLPIPKHPSLAGVALFLQMASLDTCAPSGISSSRGLSLTVRP